MSIHKAPHLPDKQAVNQVDELPSTAPAWWRSAVIYQIYPRSFNDHSGNGIGDIRGIIEKLDYISELGVDAIWVSPFFKSPMKDFGYDISDYRAVDPLFGDLTDFDELLEQAHRRNIRLIIDQVPSHTSDQHAWFLQSRKDRTNAKADWYVWADPKPDGTPPNNWLAVFGGSAWEWDSRRQQYYLHNFLASQPDLNYHNPDVRRQMLEEFEFWLQRGVDGVRVDAVASCFHDKLLRDNPPRPPSAKGSTGCQPDNPYTWQYQMYSHDQPENLGFLEELRSLLDQYDGSVSIGEISSDDSPRTMADYTNGDSRLHMAYCFELLTNQFSADHIRKTVEDLEAKLSDGWPSWTFSNHDVTRVITRWGGANPPTEFAKLLFALLCSLRGSICIYQGEELGLPEADVPRELMQDPYGKRFWPTFKGRDGCRTPMPWRSDGDSAGFSTAKPWLPVPESHRARSVAAQQADPDSVLNANRNFLTWRKHVPALCHGDNEFVDSPADVLAFIREYEGDRVLACFNLSKATQGMKFAADWNLTPLRGHGFAAPEARGQRVEIPAYGAFFASLK